MSETEHVKGALAAFVRQVTSGYAFNASYAARVVAQNSDGTLELQPDDSRLPGLSRIPMRLGVPGMRVLVPSGARCYVTFENGDPGRPIATDWELGTVMKIEITAGTIVLNDGGTPVAKEGSGTTGHVHTVVGFAGPFPITLTPTPGVTGQASDTIAVGAGSATVKVP